MDFGCIAAISEQFALKLGLSDLSSLFKISPLDKILGLFVSPLEKMLGLPVSCNVVFDTPGGTPDDKLIATFQVRSYDTKAVSLQNFTFPNSGIWSVVNEVFVSTRVEGSLADKLEQVYLLVDHVKHSVLTPRPRRRTKDE